MMYQPFQLAFSGTKYKLVPGKKKNEMTGFSFEYSSIYLLLRARAFEITSDLSLL